MSGGTSLDGSSQILRTSQLDCEVIVDLLGNTITVTENNGLYRREEDDIAPNYATQQTGLSIATVPVLLVEYWEGKSFGTSQRWPFGNVMGATRQLLTYRAIRQLGCVAHGSVAAALGAFHVVRGYRRWIGSFAGIRTGRRHPAHA
jgi:hypothetical protein